ncbi:MAG: hypothetical protein N4A62_19715 [Marinisporobacter sp.]|jgi:hypothetical protein|nr:hypothetical protein [Marinisporobacter sp.]
MNPLRYEALKTIVRIAYEIGFGKRGECNTKDDVENEEKQEI